MVVYLMEFFTEFKECGNLLKEPKSVHNIESPQYKIYSEQIGRLLAESRGYLETYIKDTIDKVNFSILYEKLMTFCMDLMEKYEKHRKLIHTTDSNRNVTYSSETYIC